MARALKTCGRINMGASCPGEKSYKTEPEKRAAAPGDRGEKLVKFRRAACRPAEFAERQQQPQGRMRDANRGSRDDFHMPSDGITTISGGETFVSGRETTASGTQRQLEQESAAGRRRTERRNKLTVVMARDARPHLPGAAPFESACKQQRGQQKRRDDFPHSRPLATSEPATTTIKKLSNSPSGAATQQARARAKPLSSSFSFNTTTLVYQIVIISLILHELPSLSPPPSTLLSQIKASNLVGAALVHSADERHDQQQQQRREQFQGAPQGAHAAGARALANNDVAHDARQQQGGGDSENSELKTNNGGRSNRARRHLAAPADAECPKLAAMWLYLKSRYPALSSHLIEWASQASGRQSDEQFLWASTPQVARTIGRLLEEADRLMAAGAKQHAQNRQFAGAAWLARVSSSPYAGLVQHLRAKQLQPQQQRPSSAQAHAPQHWPAGESPSSGAGVGVGAGQDEQRDGGKSGGNESEEAEQMSAAASQQLQQEAMGGGGGDGGAAYGRLVHYPHEIGSTDNSHGMTRTLDKLRLLNHHNRQQQQLLEQSAGGDRDIEETNRIPLATDVDQMTESDGRKLSESATDAARQNSVYGKVLLRPGQPQDPQQQQSSGGQRANWHASGHHRHPRPLATLRELFHEQERQRLMALNKQPPSPSAGLGSERTKSGKTNGAPRDDSFGQLVSGPPGASDGGLTRNTSDKSAAPHNDNQQRQRHSAQMTDASLASGNFDNQNDELESQQRFQQVAIMDDGASSGAAAAAAGAAAPSEDEFEGDFQMSPLKQPEVRLLRSLDHQNHRTQKQQQQRETTSDEQRQPELATKNSDNVFVVD